MKESAKGSSCQGKRVKFLRIAGVRRHTFMCWIAKIFVERMHCSNMPDKIPAPGNSKTAERIITDEYTKGSYENDSFKSPPALLIDTLKK